MDEITTPHYEQEPTPQPSGLILTNDAQHFLLQTAKWAKFLGIVGFVYTGILVLAAFGSHNMSSMAGAYGQSPGLLGAMGTFGMLFYIVGALISFFLSLYMYQFADRAKSAVLLANSNMLTGSFEKLKSFFKTYGIIVIISLAIMLLVLIGVMVGVGMMARAH